MFKQHFKYYKSKKPLADLSKVLDFDCDNYLPQKKIHVDSTLQLPDGFEHILKPLKNWCAFELNSNRGLIFIKNPFTPIGQRYWISRCLGDYTRRPNKLNIDVHNYLSEEQNWWEHCQKLGDDKFTEKLRWATLGYHHNWDTKVYSDEEKADFPKDLAKFCSFIASYLRFGLFTPEAAIVNFYHMDSTLSGHTDHSEKNLDAPLFSVSFGQSAIFLIGGQSIEEEPLALYIHSGDIIIMTKESRLSYHGVPKIIPANQNQPWLESESDLHDVYSPGILNSESLQISADKDLWKPFQTYVNKSRINLNVRQVNK